MAMTKHQANLIVEQLDIEEQVGVALEQFIANGGESIAPYFSGSVAYENSRKITEWAVVNLPHGPASLTIPAAFEIAFRNCRSSLVPDPHWLSTADRRKVYKALYNRLSVTQLKAIRQRDIGKLPASEAKDIERIGGLDVFLNYEAEGI